MSFELILSSRIALSVGDATAASVGTSFTSAYAAGDAASSGAISRFKARRVVLRAAGVVAAEALAATAGTVIAPVSAAGLVLLVVGIGTTVFAVVITGTTLQPWAARSYFGKGGGDKPQFATAQQEEAELALALEPPPPEEVQTVVKPQRQHDPDKAINDLRRYWGSPPVVREGPGARP